MATWRNGQMVWTCCDNAGRRSGGAAEEALRPLPSNEDGGSPRATPPTCRSTKITSILGEQHDRLVQCNMAGIAGAVVMAAMMTVARKMGLSVANMPKYQGCMITRKSEGATPVVAGMVMHLVISALIAVLYAWAFEAVWGEATWYWGLVNAVVHWLIAGFVVPMMDRMNPCVKDGRIKGFGLFGKNYSGIMVVGFLMGHLVFGAIVGWFYEVPGT